MFTAIKSLNNKMKTGRMMAVFIGAAMVTSVACSGGGGDDGGDGGGGDSGISLGANTKHVPNRVSVAQPSTTRATSSGLSTRIVGSSIRFNTVEGGGSEVDQIIQNKCQPDTSSVATAPPAMAYMQMCSSMVRLDYNLQSVAIQLMIMEDLYDELEAQCGTAADIDCSVTQGDLTSSITISDTMIQNAKQLLGGELLDSIVNDLKSGIEGSPNPPLTYKKGSHVTEAGYNVEIKLTLGADSSVAFLWNADRTRIKTVDIFSDGSRTISYDKNKDISVFKNEFKFGSTTVSESNTFKGIPEKIDQRGLIADMTIEVSGQESFKGKIEAVLDESGGGFATMTMSMLEITQINNLKIESTNNECSGYTAGNGSVHYDQNVTGTHNLTAAPGKMYVFTPAALNSGSYTPSNDSGEKIDIQSIGDMSDWDGNGKIDLMDLYFYGKLPSTLPDDVNVWEITNPFTETASYSDAFCLTDLNLNRSAVKDIYKERFDKDGNLKYMAFDENRDGTIQESEKFFFDTSYDPNADSEYASTVESGISVDPYTVSVSGVTEVDLDGRQIFLIWKGGGTPAEDGASVDSLEDGTYSPPVGEGTFIGDPDNLNTGNGMTNYDLIFYGTPDQTTSVSVFAVNQNGTLTEMTGASVSVTENTT